MPVSRTVTRSIDLCAMPVRGRSARPVDRDPDARPRPARVNLKALPTRLVSDLPEAQRIADAAVGDAGRHVRDELDVLLRSTVARNVSVTSSSTSRRLNGASSSSSLSASIFEKSSTSLMMPSRLRADGARR